MSIPKVYLLIHPGDIPKGSLPAPDSLRVAPKASQPLWTESSQPTAGVFTVTLI